ncbi:MAG: hypothetical protein HC838_05325 [Spirulinaceae cyanobacterium RM2_2_10]|nr:hypothetical protein [Spirulinaceae cyanobacterium RM2_2_10]
MNLEQDRQQCLDKLIWATKKLGVTVDTSELLKIADLIVQTMNGPWRYFHTPEHIFEVGGSANAIEVLAALFHDLVYVQVDQSVHFNLTYYISPFVRDYEERLYIREVPDLPDDLMFELVTDLFDFTPGQQLSPTAGQNEFLSALVCAKVLQPLLDLSILAQIITCIEATIPFRPEKDGISASERLFQRLQAANERFNLCLSSVEQAAAVQQAVRMANRDVGSFANPVSARFLDNTWSLLPETNHNLKNTSSYTVHDFRVALQKMEGFMNFLHPEIVFQEFRGEPSPDAYQMKLELAGRNIEIARLYLGSKLFTMALLEALSRRFGRDIPLSTLMGEMNSLGISSDKLEDFLPDVPNRYPFTNDLEREIFELLQKGRHSESDYDIKNSPLTAFIVKVVGFARIQSLVGAAKEFFNEERSPESFLELCDDEVVTAIIQALARLFDSRKAALLKPAPAYA